MSLPLCEVCRERNAKYVCQDCGRLICDFCIVPETLICSDCSASMREERFTRQVGFLTPFSILFVSIFLIFLGFFLVILSSVLRGAIEGSGAILLIGPIPIIIGAGAISPGTLILAMVLTLVAIAFFLIFFRRR